jgi:hypothetical protein
MRQHRTGRAAQADRGGRPTKYRPELARIAGQLHDNGATNAEICKALGINATTFYRWKARHPELLEAVGGWSETWKGRVGYRGECEVRLFSAKSLAAIETARGVQAPGRSGANPCKQQSRHG